MEGNRTHESYNNEQTYYEYDVANALIQSQQLGTGWSYYTYDARGNCTRKPQPSGTQYFGAGTSLSTAHMGIGPVKREVRRIFGTVRLKDLKKNVLISSFDLDNEESDPARRSWDARSFHNPPGNDSSCALLAIQGILEYHLWVACNCP